MGSLRMGEVRAAFFILGKLSIVGLIYKGRVAVHGLMFLPLDSPYPLSLLHRLVPSLSRKSSNAMCLIPCNSKMRSLEQPKSPDSVDAAASGFTYSMTLSLAWLSPVPPHRSVRRALYSLYGLFIHGTYLLVAFRCLVATLMMALFRLTMKLSVTSARITATSHYSRTAYLYKLEPIDCAGRLVCHHIPPRFFRLAQLVYAVKVSIPLILVHQWS
jgi:hypothetical protein